MEDRTCKTCDYNDDLLCDKKGIWITDRSEEHTSELQSHSDVVCSLLLEKKKRRKRKKEKCRSVE